MGDSTGKFHFVNVGRAGQPKNANDRKTIRKAAMQTFRRRERIERVKAFAVECAAKAKANAVLPPATPLGDSVADPTNAEESDLPGPPILLTKPYLPTQYGIWTEEDPISDREVLLSATSPYHFINAASLPIIPRDLGYLKDFSCGNLPDIGYLFDYYISEIIPIMMPFEGHNQRILQVFWSRSLMRDPVILQAALSHAAVYMDVVNCRKSSKSAVVHTKYAIGLINQKLSLKPFIVNNEFIEAVAMIASNSNLTGDLVESQIHMDALEEMVRMKGGRDNLGPDKFIQAVLSWSDATSARLSRSRPRFAPAISISTDTICGLAARQTPLFHKHDIFGLIEELRKLTDLKQFIDNSNTSTIEDVMAFDTQRNVLEERVLCLQHTFYTTPGLGFGDIFLDACCIAASIFMSLAFRNFSPDFPNLRTSKQDLIATILKAEALYASLNDLPDSDFPYAESLLWVLFIGGSLALGASETTWFVDRLVLVVPWTQVRSWEEAEACLKGILWIDKLRNEVCVSLWNEAENILGFKEEVRMMEDDSTAPSIPLDPLLFA